MAGTSQDCGRGAPLELSYDQHVKSLQTPTPLQVGGGGDEPPSGVDGHRVVWIKGWTSQGRTVAEVNEKENSTDPEELVIRRRTESLLWIKSNTFYRECLNDWKEQKVALGAKIDGSQKRRAEVINEIYSLIGFFSVFQGVLLTAVTQLIQSAQSSQSHRPLCGKVWFPALLSGFVAVAAAVGVLLKFMYLHKLKDDIHDYRQLQLRAEDREFKLSNQGKDFLFKGFGIKTGQARADTEYLFLKAFVIIAGVIVFTVILIVSYVVIMCDKFVLDWH